MRQDIPVFKPLTSRRRTSRPCRPQNTRHLTGRRHTVADETAVGSPTGDAETWQATSREAALPTSILLEVQHLVKAFGGVRAVDDCSFTVARGSITGLIGPHGAGKSTAANLIT